MILAFNAGLLLSFVVGAYCSYALQTKILIAVPVVFLILFSVCPESPDFLARRSKQEVIRSGVFGE